MAQIKKVLNSSVVLVEDEQENDFIILGKGIGFGKKRGEYLPDNQEDYQLYIPIKNDQAKQIVSLLDSISPELLDTTYKVISLAKRKLNVDFHDSLYFVLADHLNFAIERHEKGMVLTNRMTWEIQSFYPDEYAVAVECLSLVNSLLDIKLPEQEEVNIAFHLVNAQSAHNPEYDSARYAKLIGEIVNIVRYSLNKDLNKDSVHYLRFITHIRFFVERFFTNKMLEETEDTLYQTFKLQYKRETEIANKVKGFLYEKYQKIITDEEMSFLIIHINRLSRE